MAHPHQTPLERQVHITRLVSRIAIAMVILACGAGLALSLAKANRVACIDDLEVAWRIDVGQGVSDLIRGDESQLDQRADELDVTTAQLIEVENGDRCVYSPPWPLTVFDG